MILDLNNLFEKFKMLSQELPEKEKYTKNDLLRPSLEIFSDQKIQIYYAPTDFINSKAKIFILGITPGWAQMEIFCRVARSALLKGASPDQASRLAKQKASFAGSMRKNMVAMLDELGLAAKLKIPTISDLFAEDNDLLHSSSAIRYPVFFKGSNYTGHGVDPLKHEILMKIINSCLTLDIKQTQSALIVPLGNAVSLILQHFITTGQLTAERCLFGFPHPSGANGHRYRQFKENKAELKQKIQNWF